jgi:hypothetical protein
VEEARNFLRVSKSDRHRRQNPHKILMTRITHIQILDSSPKEDSVRDRRPFGRNAKLIKKLYWIWWMSIDFHFACEFQRVGRISRLDISPAAGVFVGSEAVRLSSGISLVRRFHRFGVLEERTRSCFWNLSFFLSDSSEARRTRSPGRFWTQ